MRIEFSFFRFFVRPIRVTLSDLELEVELQHAPTLTATLQSRVERIIATLAAERLERLANLFAAAETSSEADQPKNASGGLVAWIKRSVTQHFLQNIELEIRNVHARASTPGGASPVAAPRGAAAPDAAVLGVCLEVFEIRQSRKHRTVFSGGADGNDFIHNFLHKLLRVTNLAFYCDCEPLLEAAPAEAHAPVERRLDDVSEADSAGSNRVTLLPPERTSNHAWLLAPLTITVELSIRSKWLGAVVGGSVAAAAAAAAADRYSTEPAQRVPVHAMLALSPLTLALSERQCQCLLHLQSELASGRSDEAVRGARRSADSYLRGSIAFQGVLDLSDEYVSLRKRARAGEKLTAKLRTRLDVLTVATPLEDLQALHRANFEGGGERERAKRVSADAVATAPSWARAQELLQQGAITLALQQKEATTALTADGNAPLEVVGEAKADAKGDVTEGVKENDAGDDALGGNAPGLDEQSLGRLLTGGVWITVSIPTASTSLLEGNGRLEGHGRLEGNGNARRAEAERGCSVQGAEMTRLVLGGLKMGGAAAARVLPAGALLPTFAFAMLELKEVQIFDPSFDAAAVCAGAADAGGGGRASAMSPIWLPRTLSTVPQLGVPPHELAHLAMDHSMSEPDDEMVKAECAFSAGDSSRPPSLGLSLRLRPIELVLHRALLERSLGWVQRALADAEEHAKPDDRPAAAGPMQLLGPAGVGWEGLTLSVEVAAELPVVAILLDGVNSRPRSPSSPGLGSSIGHTISRHSHEHSHTSTISSLATESSLAQRNPRTRGGIAASRVLVLNMGSVLVKHHSDSASVFPSRFSLGWGGGSDSTRLALLVSWTDVNVRCLAAWPKEPTPLNSRNAPPCVDFALSAAMTLVAFEGAVCVRALRCRCDRSKISLSKQFLDGSAELVELLAPLLHAGGGKNASQMSDSRMSADARTLERGSSPGASEVIASRVLLEIFSSRWITKKPTADEAREASHLRRLGHKYAMCDRQSDAALDAVHRASLSQTANRMATAAPAATEDAAAAAAAATATEDAAATAAVGAARAADAGVIVSKAPDVPDSPGGESRDSHFPCCHITLELRCFSVYIVAARRSSVTLMGRRAGRAQARDRLKGIAPAPLVVVRGLRFGYVHSAPIAVLGSACLKAHKTPINALATIGGGGGLASTAAGVALSIDAITLCGNGVQGKRGVASQPKLRSPGGSSGSGSSSGSSSSGSSGNSSSSDSSSDNDSSSDSDSDSSSSDSSSSDSSSSSDEDSAVKRGSSRSNVKKSHVDGEKDRINWLAESTDGESDTTSDSDSSDGTSDSTDDESGAAQVVSDKIKLPIRTADNLEGLEALLAVRSVGSAVLVFGGYWQEPPLTLATMRVHGRDSLPPDEHEAQAYCPKAGAGSAFAQLELCIRHLHLALKPSQFFSVYELALPLVSRAGAAFVSPPVTALAKLPSSSSTALPLPPSPPPPPAFAQLELRLRVRNAQIALSAPNKQHAVLQLSLAGTYTASAGEKSFVEHHKEHLTMQTALRLNLNEIFNSDASSRTQSERLVKGTVGLEYMFDLETPESAEGAAETSVTDVESHECINRPTRISEAEYLATEAEVPEVLRQRISLHVPPVAVRAPLAEICAFADTLLVLGKRLGRKARTLQARYPLARLEDRPSTALDLTPSAIAPAAIAPTGMSSGFGSVSSGLIASGDAAAPTPSSAYMLCEAMITIELISVTLSEDSAHGDPESSLEVRITDLLTLGEWKPSGSMRARLGFSFVVRDRLLVGGAWEEPIEYTMLNCVLQRLDANDALRIRMRLPFRLNVLVTQRQLTRVRAMLDVLSPDASGTRMCRHAPDQYADFASAERSLEARGDGDDDAVGQASVAQETTMGNAPWLVNELGEAIWLTRNGVPWALRSGERVQLVRPQFTLSSNKMSAHAHMGGTSNAAFLRLTNAWAERMSLEQIWAFGERQLWAAALRHHDLTETALATSNKAASEDASAHHAKGRFAVLSMRARCTMATLRGHNLKIPTDLNTAARLQSDAQGGPAQIVLGSSWLHGNGALVLRSRLSLDNKTPTSIALCLMPPEGSAHESGALSLEAAAQQAQRLLERENGPEVREGTTLKKAAPGSGRFKSLKRFTPNRTLVGEVISPPRAGSRSGIDSRDTPKVAASRAPDSAFVPCFTRLEPLQTYNMPLALLLHPRFETWTLKVSLVQLLSGAETRTRAHAHVFTYTQGRVRTHTHTHTCVCKQGLPVECFGSPCARRYCPLIHSHCPLHSSLRIPSAFPATFISLTPSFTATVPPGGCPRPVTLCPLGRRRGARGPSC